ncbi:MAG: hypothetical protein NTZ78_02855 [Candidatus Aureabacteria bacterium]|nr:hypothetical protein [Candidatus Auribacterota bacterium]
MNENLGERKPARGSMEGVSRRRSRMARLYALTTGILIVIAFVAVWSMHRRSGGSGERSEVRPTPRESRPLFNNAQRPRIEWVREKLIARGAANPLTVLIPARQGPGGGMGAPRELSVSMEGNTLLIGTAGNTRRRTLDQIDPVMLAAIAAAIEKEDGASHPTPNGLHPKN